MNWLIAATWLVGMLWAVRWLMLFTIDSYRRDDLGWDASLTWSHAFLFAVASPLWPLIALWALTRLVWRRVAGGSDPLTRWADRAYEADQ